MGVLVKMVALVSDLAIEMGGFRCADEVLQAEKVTRATVSSAARSRRTAASLLWERMGAEIFKNEALGYDAGERGVFPSSLSS
jgi:hypothetical protein